MTAATLASDCCCAELTASDRPCPRCRARATEIATPVAPAFPLRNASVWNTLASYQIGEAQCTRQVLVMSADPSGADVTVLAIAKLRADTPGAEQLRLLRVEFLGECWGTAVVPGARHGS